MITIGAKSTTSNSSNYTRTHKVLVPETQVDNEAFEDGEAEWEMLENNRRDTFDERHGVSLSLCNAANVVEFSAPILTNDIRTRPHLRK